MGPRGSTVQRHPPLDVVAEKADRLGLPHAGQGGDIVEFVDGVLEAQPFDPGAAGQVDNEQPAPGLGDPLAHLRGNAPVAIPAPGEAYPATAQLDMTLFFTERSDGLDGALVFSTELFDAERMVSMIARLVALLERACAMPGRSIDELLADDEAPTGMVALDEAGDEWASP